MLGSGIEYLIYSVVVAIFSILDLVTGGLAALLFVPFLLAMIGLRDAKGGTFSIGKRIGGLRVVDVQTRQPAADRQGLVRNSIYLVLVLLMTFPAVAGVFGVLFMLSVMLDVLMILANPQGRRLGDFLAGTQVVQEAQG